MIKHFISNNIEEYEIPRLQGKVKDLLNSKQHETKTLKSNFNGYGYQDTTYKYILNNDDYNEIKLFIENKNKQKKDRKELTEEEKIEKWSERLSKLTGISLEEAKKIAYEKIEYKENRYIEMIDNYNENPSKKNYQLANKIKNSNPLRYIEDKEHAENILIASKRHNNSNYEELIEEGKEMAKYGEIEYSEIKDYARNNYEYFDKEDNIIEDDFMVFEENTSGNILVVQQTNNQYQFNTYLFDKDKEFINFKKISTLFDKTVTEKDNEFSNACDSAMEFYGINKLDVYILELSVILPELKKIISNIEKAKKDGYEAGYNEESFDDFIESMQVNNGTSNVVLEKMYENEMNFNKRPDYLDSEGNPHWYNEDDEDNEDLYFNEDDEDNEDIYFKLADKICQAAYEDSASGFYTELDFEEISKIAYKDIDWVKVHIEKIGEALIEHNNELLLDFNPDKNINKENNTIEFNFCSVGEDANELFKYENNRWIRKTDKELENEGLLKPTVEVFKESFESFIQTIPFAANESIKNDLEQIKANALYVYHSSSEEYAIISRQENEKTFMVHKYYPSNENGGLHQGAYDISTFETAEQNAIRRIVDLSEVNYELKKWVAGTREEEFNRILKNDLSSVIEYINEYVAKEDEKIELVDVKTYEYGESNNKIKVLVEYNGNFREDDFFNILNEEDEELGFRTINGCVIDFNPINPEKSGTISEYLEILKNIEEKNSNTESTLKNYKKQALELCSKDNPTLKLTMFIKNLVKDLSNEEKLNLFKQVNETISQEINNLQENCNQTENNKTNSNKGKGR